MHPKIKAVLADANFPFVVHHHRNFSQPIASPQDFAHALGYSVERITKSVFLRIKNEDRYLVAVCSSNKRLNFDIIKEIFNAKKIVVATLDELNKLIEYPPTGVSPIGLSENIRIVVDQKLFESETVLIGSGEVGVEIELSPHDLLKVIAAEVFLITSEDCESTMTADK